MQHENILGINFLVLFNFPHILTSNTASLTLKTLKVNLSLPFVIYEYKNVII
jgi:hypothetical protein